MSAQIFNYGTQAEYDAALAGNIIEPTALYFILDTQRIYRGKDIAAMTSVFYVDEVPSKSDMREHTMYVVNNYVYAKIDDEIICLNHELIQGAINSLTLFDNSIIVDSSTKDFTPSDDTLMTSKKIVSMMASQTESSVVGATWLRDEGNISFDLHKEGESFDLGLDGVVHDVTYDNKKYQLIIPVYGSDDIVVNIPKCVKSGRYESNYLLPDGTYGKAIVLVIDAPGTPTGESEIVIPADGFVKIYEPYESSSIKIAISDNNEIMGEVKISPTETRLKVNEDGLSLDISDYALHANPEDVDKVAVIDSEGNFVGSKKIVDVYKESESEFTDMLPTFGVVSAAISEALRSVNKHILPEGASDMLVVSTETGLDRSAYKIGGSKLDLKSADTLVATEAAVIDALSWSSI